MVMSSLKHQQHINKEVESMINKTQKIRELLELGYVDEALKIGKTFRKGDKTLLYDIKRGFDASS